jgi:HSP20 family protein
MTTGTAMAPAKPEKPMPWTDPFRLFRNRPTRLLDEPFSLFRAFAPFFEENLPLTTWTPLCDVFETPKEIVVKAELPGVQKEHLHVNIENTVLTLRGERAFEEETTRESYHRVERNYGEFMRSFTLPTTVDPNRIHAVFNDGVLTLRLPKREEALPKQIEVKVQ